jgi:sugar lactone lactonase YvrE
VRAFKTSLINSATVAAALLMCVIVQAQQPTATSSQAGRQPPPDGGPFTGTGPRGSARKDPGANLMSHPYRLTENWPTLNPGMRWGSGAAFFPDGKGNLWAVIRTEPPILLFDRTGKIVKSFGDGIFALAHGACRDRDGNFWVGDAPFTGGVANTTKGFQVHKFSPDGKLLLSLGRAGVAAVGPDTFIGPTTCVQLPNGDMLIADGHWPRPANIAQDGDRLVQYTNDGKYVRDYGKLGRGPGEFMGPHSLAIDSQQRIFVADRSNNRIQIFDKDMNFLDSWRHFGRPSGVVILKDDTLIVADSESGIPLPGPKESVEGAANTYRNVGWRQGIRIGSAKDGSIRYFLDGTNPEGLGADAAGNIYAGLTQGCPSERTGGCVEKWVPIRAR